MKITLLGTGTPAPSVERQSSGYLVEVGNDVIVMDHGPGAHHRLLEAGYHSTEVTHAFFTHLHYDHFMDYPRLLIQRWDMGAGKIPELKVFGPSPLAKITDQLISKDGVFGLDIESRVSHQASLDVFASRGGVLPRKKPNPEVSEIKAGDIINGDNWRIIVGKALHFQPILECLAIRLEAETGTLVYTGDSGLCDEIIELARDCDVLIAMNHIASGMELTPEYRQTIGNHLDIAEIAKKARARTVVLSHFLKDLDRAGVKEKLISEMALIYDGNIILGEDLMKIPLNVSIPHHHDL